MSWVVRYKGVKRDGSEKDVSRFVNDEDTLRESIRHNKINSFIGFHLLDPAFKKTKNAVILLFAVPVGLRFYFTFFKRNRHLMHFVIGASLVGLGYNYVHAKYNDLDEFIRRDTIPANSVRELLRQDMIDRQTWIDHSPITKQIIVNRAFGLELEMANQNQSKQAATKQSKFSPKAPSSTQPTSESN